MQYIFYKKTGLLSMNTMRGEPMFLKPMEIAMKEKAAQYASVKLTTDLSVLTAKEKQMLPLLFEAAKIMEELYWKEVFAGEPKAFLEGIKDENMKKYAAINFGPWERLNDNISFMAEFGAKPLGACFYPQDMTKEEYEKFKDPNKKSLYTVIVREPALQGKQEGSLKAVFYHEYFKDEVTKASDLIKKAAELAEDPALKNYLQLRAEALLTDDYFASDNAWLDMKNNTIDFVIGPIETYEDALFGIKAAHESFILIKDKEWSKKLEKFTAFLPELQKMLPVEEKYKSETPGSSGNELNAYDVVFYAGDCNAGSKTIAINLPNDEKVRQTKGSRKLQLKNAMKAKFDKILLPIANILIDPSQRKYVKFDAFFTNTMFHEVGHGLGCDYVAGNKKLTVRDALKDYYTSIEEGKADILGLFIVDKLYEKGELGKVELMDYYVTFMAGIFRSVRFGAASAHGKSNMMRFYYFQEKGAFEKDAKTGYYKINFDKMRKAMLDIAELILTIQGAGDYSAAKKWTDKDGQIRPELQKDLDKVNNSGIPVDIVFEQGASVLGL
ncbi:MAG: Zn-dependent hydrolase [Bacteroidetes bacterium GWF2_38_335]|nr:MAG: Zn-dependent hydrolase [Bacteroidetes bacterium GWF2_38_335]OFY80563.1 MAG: Zn-dependent hydrolase [Bacteroidetes bacterium RIFOXYA12_FULL_38_20]HBS85875.1 Zn-dependent hydrolase [Bacteroidales bacterium]